jgi:hypothetical protein
VGLLCSNKIILERHVADITKSYFYCQYITFSSVGLNPITVAARPKAWVLAAWELGSSVRILLRIWMVVLVLLRRAVLCK